MNIRIVAIIGAGIMGSGIAQIVAKAGFEVVIRSRKGKKGLISLHKGLEKAKSRGILNEDQIASMLSKINCTKDICKAVENADFVIEAAKEDMSLKKNIFRELDSYSPKHTILASNTSSLKISKLANATRRSNKVIGIHFFNPVPIMKLVEIATADHTSKETENDTIEFVKKLGKTPLIVKDSPGFVVNRILIPMINEAAYVLSEGIATADDIDSSMKLGANHPIGPLVLADLIGIDVCLNIMEEFSRTFNNSKYKPCPLLTTMVDEHRLGRKVGKGFHDYQQT